MSLLMTGMQTHLDSGQAAVRTQGMVVAEALTAKMDVPGGEKLNFEVTLQIIINLTLKSHEISTIRVTYVSLHC